MVHVWHLVQHWLAIHTGTDNESGPFYGFWSGFGSDLGEVTLLAAVIGLYRSRNCHAKGCWRLGHHPYVDENGIESRYCRACHPILKGKHRSRAEVHAHHAARPEYR